MSTRRPRLLDLFCCAGGAAEGYHRAGFDVVGIDIRPQPRYPYNFLQGDALAFLAEHGREFDAIHASPPCQAYSDMKYMPTAGKHPELIVPTRELLLQIGRPYAIENVEGAPLETGSLFGGITLCGSMFGLRTNSHELRRHRLFEISPSMPQPVCAHSDLPVIGFYGDHARIRRRVNGSKDRGKDITGRDRKLALVKELMDIDWMEWEEAVQAIPPAYTEYIGRHLMETVGSVSLISQRIPVCPSTSESAERKPPKPNPCPKCGADLPDRNMTTAPCEKCLNTAYLATLRDREGEALVKDPNPLYHVAMGKGRLRHIVLRSDNGFCFCGEKPQGPRKQWLRVHLRELPKDVCTDCLRAVEHVLRAIHPV